MLKTNFLLLLFSTIVLLGCVEEMKLTKNQEKTETIRGIAQETKLGLEVDGVILINQEPREIAKYRGKQVEVTGKIEEAPELVIEQYEEGKPVMQGVEGAAPRVMRNITSIKILEPNEVQEYNSIAEFLENNSDSLYKQLEITVEGNENKSLYGKLNCVYYEWATLFYSEENKKNASQYSVVTEKGSSKEDFYILIEGKYKVKIKPSSELRLFTGPTFEKSFNKTNAPTEDAKQTLEENANLVMGRQVDYCLQKGKTYYLFLKKESFKYGPPDETGRRASSSYIFLQISDKEFKNNQPQEKETPTYSNWIYG